MSSAQSLQVSDLYVSVMKYVSLYGNEPEMVLKSMTLEKPNELSHLTVKALCTFITVMAFSTFISYENTTH